MGRIAVTEFASLDGVIEDPGGSEDFEHGGWSFEFSRGEEGDKFKLDEALEAEALLLGRVTYEGFAEAWPTRSGQFADKFNSMPKYVVSSNIEGSALEQHEGARRRSHRARREFEGGDRWGRRGPRQRPARADTAGARPRR